MKKAKEGDLRVWHMPQVPMEKSFYVKVKSIDEAKLILNILWDYNIFQFINKIKPDYSNVSGLEVYENEEWCNWCNEEGDDIDSIMGGKV